MTGLNDSKMHFTGTDSTISVCEQGQLPCKARNHKTKAVIADEI